MVDEYQSGYPYRAILPTKMLRPANFVQRSPSSPGRHCKVPVLLEYTTSQGWLRKCANRDMGWLISSIVVPGTATNA